MSGTSSTNNDGKGPPIDGGDGGPDHSDAVQDTWETGLRRRRRRSRQNSMDNEDENDENGNGNNFNQNNNSYRSMNGTPSPNNISDGNYNSGIGTATGGLCSSGGSATVGVLSNSHAVGNNAFGGGGGPYSTPYKTPMKENVAGDLVAATPSSITTAGDTAESTTMLSTSPLSIIRRRSSPSSRRGPSHTNQSAVPSLRRQYQLLRSQILLLLCSSTIGLILFLFYALPLAAFISLALMTTSMGAFIPVARSIIIARYEMEMDQPGGLTRYLPEYIRVMLTETSLHDFMTDTTFMMEHRYLLLYFMPGLEPEQLMGYINQLPQRHREALLQPGLGRLMPSVMENLMRIESGGQEYQQQFDQQLMLENGDDASGLTVDREQHQGENDAVDVDDNAQVTLLEAVTGLRRTLAAAANIGGVPEPNASAEEEMQTPLPITNDVAASSMNNNANQEDVQDDDDNSSFDFSVDIDAHGLNDMLIGNQDHDEVPAATSNTPANNNNPGLRNVIVEMPSQPSGLDSDASNNTEDQNEVQQQQEYDLEGRILSEAANAAARNYASQAARIARDTTSDAVVATSSWFIRAGSLTGLIAGAGGVVAAVLANQQGGSSLVSITSGTLSGPTTTTGSVDSSSRGADNATNGTIERQNNNSGYQTAIQGLFATSAFGFLGAGVAYLVRNGVRTSIAKKREEKRLEDAQNEGEDKP